LNTIFEHIGSFKTQKNYGQLFSKAKKNNGSSLFFQPKLTINQPNDIYEQEAEEKADSENIPQNPCEKVTGPLTCFENSTLNGSSTYKVVVSCLNEGSKICFDNFYGIRQKVYGSVTNDTITIDLCKVSNFTIEGSGVITKEKYKDRGAIFTKHKVELKYTVNDGADIDTCTAKLLNPKPLILFSK